MQAVSFAKKHVLEHGPIILEMDTYRYHGHSMSDPGSTYRTRDEISSMRQLRDPVEHVRKLLLEKAGADPAELKKIEKVCYGLPSCSSRLLACLLACCQARAVNNTTSVFACIIRWKCATAFSVSDEHAT